MTRFLAAAAAVTLAFALQVSNGFLDPLALALVVLAGVLALLAARRARAGEAAGDEPGAARTVRLRLATQIALGGGSAASLGCTLLSRPAFFVPEAQLGPVRALALAALLLLSAYLCVHLRPAFARARFGLLLALAFAMGAAILQRSPHPWIDVWYFQQLGAGALLSGHNPYAIDYPDLYSGAHLPFNDPRFIHAGTVHGMPYLPLPLLLGMPARLLFGDIRFLHLFALIAAAVLLARLGRAAGDALTGELAGLFVALQPRALFVLEQAWTDPLVLACIFLAALAAVHLWRSPTFARPAWLCGLAFGLALASKQYTPLALVPLFFALPRPARPRVAAGALLVIAAICLPFALWNFHELVFGTVWMQLYQPLRRDALSLVAVAARFMPIGRPVAAAGFLAAFAIVAAFWPRPGRLAASLTTSGAAFIWFFLLNKQAFCNYYFLCVGLLCAACTLPTDAKSLASPAPPR